MKTHSFLIKNSRAVLLNLVLEPLAHVFDLAPGSVLEVFVEQQPEAEAIEIECFEDSVVIYSGGIAIVRSNGVEIEPQFMK